MALPLHPHAEAHGKVILLGEHAVVHGYPAIAAGLPGGVSLEATPLERATDPIRVTVPDWDLDVDLGAQEDDVARACAEVLSFCDGPLTGWQIRGRSKLPTRAGLGSSAALTVALARLALGPDASLEDTIAASMAGERIFHGTPSGIDSTVAAAGGILRFARGTAPEPVHAAAPLPLVILPSGIPRRTVDQVARVGTLLRSRPTLTRGIFDLLAGLVAEGITALERCDLEHLGASMTVAHELLSALGVSSPTLDALCARAQANGAFGAKLTGAGLGGCVIAIPPPDPAPLLADCSDLNPLSVTIIP